jgi:hypothetical protein
VGKCRFTVSNFMKICSLSPEMLHAELDICGTVYRCFIATFHCEHQKYNGKYVNMYNLESRPVCLRTGHGGKSLSFQCFFSLLGIKRNHRGLGPVNRVGGECRSIPGRTKTGSQKKQCELGRCRDAETIHPISTFLGVFFAHSLSNASKPPSKIPD